jgi:cysteinyl-tRNA synthetase
LQWENKDNSLSGDLVNGLMQAIIQLRADARKDKNFKISDFIRDEMKQLNIQLKDTTTGTEWEVLS